MTCTCHSRNAHQQTRYLSFPVSRHNCTPPHFSPRLPIFPQQARIGEEDISRGGQASRFPLQCGNHRAVPFLLVARVIVTIPCTGEYVNARASGPGLPTRPVGNVRLPVFALKEENAQRWLIDGLWGDSSVGIIGGAPKCSKTWLGLDMALSVATGTACLGKYAVPQAGPVLVYLAEDALSIVRERVAGMARHRGLDLAGVEIHVITAPTLRLDRDPHRLRLLATAKQLRPRLLLLDPLVRLHGVDENHATEMAALLAYFRSLQRQLDLSVVLVHHTRKNAAGGFAAGQSLRGSSDLHAFGDSNLYLRRAKQHLVLLSEHRAAPLRLPCVCSWSAARRRPRIWR